MDGQKVEVVVESSENSSDWISNQVTSSGSQLVGPSFKCFTKSLSAQSQSNCSHFSNSKAPVNHMVSPCLHGLLELREVFWWLILSNVLSDISNIPKISPLGIEGRRIGSISLVLSLVVVNNIVMLTCLLCVFWCCSNLEVLLWEDIRNGLSSIKLGRSSVEKLFHLVQELIVLFHVYSWILDNQAPIFVKCVCHGFTVLCVVS